MIRATVVRALVLAAAFAAALTPVTCLGEDSNQLPTRATKELPPELLSLLRGGLAAFENSIDEVGGSAMILGIVHAITYESSGLDIRVLTGDGRQFQGLCQFRYAAKFLDEQEIPQDDPGSDPGGMESLERGLEIGL